MIKKIFAITLIASTCMSMDDSTKPLQGSPSKSPFQSLRASPLEDIDDTMHDFMKRLSVQSPVPTMEGMDVRKSPTRSPLSRTVSALDLMHLKQPSAPYVPLKKTPDPVPDDDFDALFGEDGSFAAAAAQKPDGPGVYEETLDAVMADLRLRYAAAKLSTTPAEYAEKVSMYYDVAKKKRKKARK